MSDLNVKIEKTIANKIFRIAKNKFPLRKIDFYSEAVREALIEFIKRNKKYDVAPKSSEDSSIKTEASI